MAETATIRVTRTTREEEDRDWEATLEDGIE
jgi:hypothetical protein